VDPYLMALPDDGVWYTLVVRRLRTHRERGYLTVTVGSALVQGSGTEFTRWLAFTDDAIGRGGRLRIPDNTEVPRVLGRGGSAVGNEGSYEIDTITNDTQLTLRTPVSGANEAGLIYVIEGDYTGTPPTAPDGDLHWYDRAEFELVARTIVPAAGDIILADVMYDSGADPTVQIIDRRRGSLYRPMPHDLGGAIVLGSQCRNGTAGSSDAATPWFDTLYRVTSGFGATLESIDAAPMPGGWLCVVQADTEIRAFWWERLSSHAPGTSDYGWVEPLGATVTIDNSGSATDVALVQVPQPDADGAVPAEATHICFYVKSQIAYRRYSTDNGATWSGETIVWNPTTVDPNDEILHLSAILLQCGRLILIASYRDDSASEYSIRYVYSDDLGATWSTNTDAGFTWAADAGENYLAPAIYQDDFGRIHTAFIQENWNGTYPGIWHEISISPYLLSRTGGGTTPLGACMISDGNILQGAEGQRRANSIAVWAHPNGNAAVLRPEPLSAAAGTDRKLYAHCFGTGLDASDRVRAPSGIDHYIVAILDTEPHTTRKTCPRLKQAGGGLHLWYIDIENEDVYWVPLSVGWVPAQIGLALT
jgi:hypothetical protein